MSSSKLVSSCKGETTEARGLGESAPVDVKGSFCRQQVKLQCLHTGFEVAYKPLRKKTVHAIEIGMLTAALTGHSCICRDGTVSQDWQSI